MHQIHSTTSTSSSLQAKDLSANVLPEGIKGWSWGAFWFSWVWAIFNKTWIGLLALIPLVNLVMMVILGLKGREWAWKNKEWPSIDHFNRVQKRWSIAAWLIMAGAFASGITLGIIEDRTKYLGDIGFNSSESPTEDLSKNSPFDSIPAHSDTPPQKAMSPYPMPSMIFGKIDLLGGMKRANIEQPWISHFTKYINEPEKFWQECVTQEAEMAQNFGGMAKNEAQSHGENACKSLVEHHYSCLNGQSLDDAVLCLQGHINDMAENGQ